MSEEVLEKYDYLMVEGNLKEDFKKMERWEKLCTEIEIYEHCSHNLDGYPTCTYLIDDCSHCSFANLNILKEIDAFANELRTTGYFVYKNFRWWLIVSKIQSIARCISHPSMNNRNDAGIRGLVFGYSIDKIKDWIKETNQDGLKE